jgi:hypothetical protein
MNNTNLYKQLKLYAIASVPIISAALAGLLIAADKPKESSQSKPTAAIVETVKTESLDSMLESQALDKVLKVVTEGKSGLNYTNLNKNSYAYLSSGLEISNGMFYGGVPTGNGRFVEFGDDRIIMAGNVSDNPKDAVVFVYDKNKVEFSLVSGSQIFSYKHVSKDGLVRESVVPGSGSTNGIQTARTKPSTEMLDKYNGLVKQIQALYETKSKN